MILQAYYINLIFTRSRFLTPLPPPPPLSPHTHVTWKHKCCCHIYYKGRHTNVASIGSSLTNKGENFPSNYFGAFSTLSLWEERDNEDLGVKLFFNYAVRLFVENNNNALNKFTYFNIVIYLIVSILACYWVQRRHAICRIVAIVVRNSPKLKYIIDVCNCVNPSIEHPNENTGATFKRASGLNLRVAAVASKNLRKG